MAAQFVSLYRIIYYLREMVAQFVSLYLYVGLLLKRNGGTSMIWILFRQLSTDIQEKKHFFLYLRQNIPISFIIQKLNNNYLKLKFKKIVDFKWTFFVLSWKGALQNDFRLKVDFSAIFAHLCHLPRSMFECTEC